MELEPYITSYMQINSDDLKTIWDHENEGLAYLEDAVVSTGQRC